MRQIVHSILVVFFVLSVVVDRFFKYIARTSPEMSERFWFETTPRINTDAALSIPIGSIYFDVFLIVVWMLLVVWWMKNRNADWSAFLFGIVLAAASNVWDRIFYGGVIDYLPFLGISILNISDIIITVGSFLLVYFFYKKSREVILV